MSEINSSVCNIHYELDKSDANIHFVVDQKWLESRFWLRFILIVKYLNGIYCICLRFCFVISGRKIMLFYWISCMILTQLFNFLNLDEKRKKKRGWLEIVFFGERRMLFHKAINNITNLHRHRRVFILHAAGETNSLNICNFEKYSSSDVYKRNIICDKEA